MGMPEAWRVHVFDSMTLVMRAGQEAPTGGILSAVRRNDVWTGRRPVSASAERTSRMGALPVGGSVRESGTRESGQQEKRPNAQLASWFLRSGWSKGELARQVNRRARQIGAHHISTDTSRVRRWLDGEQPREPIPRILSELFSERFGSVVALEDLGLRPAPQPPAVSGVDLPWAAPKTVELMNEFSRSDL